MKCAMRSPRRSKRALGEFLLDMLGDIVHFVTITYYVTYVFRVYELLVRVAFENVHELADAMVESRLRVRQAYFFPKA